MQRKKNDKKVLKIKISCLYCIYRGNEKTEEKKVSEKRLKFGVKTRKITNTRKKPNKPPPQKPLIFTPILQPHIKN